MSEDSGKSRALRIRLDYHKQRGPLEWYRRACVIVALIGSCSYAVVVLAGVFLPRDDSGKSRAGWLDSAALQVSTGPLSKVHAHFESDCHQCHAESAFRPIASDAFKLDIQASIDSLSKKCQSCHSVQSHIEGVSSTTCIRLDKNCAECHQEHQGREVDLASLTSHKCTQCHANLSKVCGDSTDFTVNANIDKFSVESHAATLQTFRSLGNDPGRIKFSHAQHMNLGQVKTGRRGGFQLNMMLERWRGNYSVVGEQGVVQLTCGNCHKLQTPTGTVAPEQMANASSSTDVELTHFYAPIKFDEHCVACHQFTFTGQTAAMTPLPHAATKDDFRQILSSRLVGGKLNGQLSVRKDNADDELQFENLVNAELKTVVDRVYSGCNKCHSDEVPQRVDSQNPMLPQRWLQRGFFDHGAHARISECAFCHVIPASEDSTSSSMVMIKGPESCTPCHRSKSDSNSAAQMTREDRKRLLGNANQPSQASDNCTLCHRYHWSRPKSESEPRVTDSEFIGIIP